MSEDEYTRQHYGYATTGQPTQTPGKAATGESKAPPAPPTPKEKK